MTKLAAKLQTLRSREEGATAVEYGVLIALIIAVLIVVIGFLGTDLLAAFNVVEDQLGGDQG
ncbi:Flp family type IVb pilin [Intrasporangium calvum]|uniref:Flp family type IVb pilin n=1 Tax=Intrasporangium calvum TaxID=53358 RepID=A0ABT5GIU4_9MICO|nr:Flp family type IVb pilin [Intrasporangium calvum]MDC5698134.1 Flp family type IVb pilin [Intrasporangium calvum]